MLRCILERWLGAASRAGQQLVDLQTMTVLPSREIERMRLRPSMRLCPVRASTSLAVGKTPVS